MEIASEESSSVWSSGIPHLDELWKLNNSRTLRLVKGIAGTGKSELLLQIALSSILPRSRDGLIFNGNESIVIFFSNDQKFSLSRLIHLFYQRIISAASVASKSSPPEGAQEPSETTIDSLLQECLSRLWILRCQDWLQFKTSMIALPRRLADLKKKNSKTTETNSSSVPSLPVTSSSGDTPITMLIDSLDTFYLLEGKQSSQYESTEELVRNFLHTNSQSMIFASVSDMNTTTNSMHSSILTLNMGMADFNGNSCPFRIDSDHGFTLT